MSIRIIKNGLMDTIQDMGRDGYAYLGINPGGAMDRVAMQAANALVGNELSAPVIEMHFPAAEILFEESQLIALAGADAAAYADGVAIPFLHPVLVNKNATLTIGKRNSGARIYLAVKGSFELIPWLNSYSTNSKAAAGGLEGRALRKGGRISTHPQYFAGLNGPALVFPWSANLTDLYSNDVIHFVAGEHYPGLNGFSLEKLRHHPCTIRRESDRMGYRLKTETLHLTQSAECISSAVTRGTIQLLPDGQLIVLMADHQTTGGYPVIGYVAGADFPSLAQKQAGDHFLLREIPLSSAENFMYQQQMILQQLQNACNFRLEQYF